jgi:hypothetical protein
MAIKDLHPAQTPFRPRGNSGQAAVEYILLLSFIVTGYVIIARLFTSSGITQKITSPITVTFAKTYQFGDPRAKSFEDGAPDFHPRADGGQSSFRIFINPEF